MTELTKMTPDSEKPVAVSQVVEASLIAPAESIGSGGSLGELLRQAREKAGLSTGDVASRLRMGIKQVRALEEDDYAALPTGTFLRGFVRNFAKEVGVNSELALKVLAETHQAAASITASAVIMPAQQNINVAAASGTFATPRARAFIAIAIGVLLLTVAWWWWEYVRPHRADVGRPNTVVEEKAVTVPFATPSVRVASDGAPVQDAVPASQLTKQITDASVLPVSPSLALQQPASAVMVPSLAQVAEMAPAPEKSAVIGGNGQLGFTFSGDSWVEVVDRNGKSLLDRKFKSGDAEEVIGRSPFSVVIGNASATRMAHNGKEVDLAPHTRASVARLRVK